ALQESFVTNWMEHVQGVETFPRPILDPLALALLGQLGHGDGGRGDKQFVIVLIGRSQPLRGPIGEGFLEERGAPPLIKTGIFSQKRLEEEVERRPARCVKK